jgi:hypothetical protein
MPQDLMTPVGRLVQGGFKLRQKTDDHDKPVFKDGVAVMETFIAIAVPKLLVVNGQSIKNPDWDRFYAELYAVARSECGSYFDANGVCTHPGFSWKIKDGDGRDANGTDLSGKPGFAGCWIINCSTQFMPNVFHEGKFAPHEVIQNPDDVVKKGYYVRASVRVAGNGITPADAPRKPGIFVSQQLVSLVGYGDVISTGPDAAAAFAQPAAYIPPGMTTTPTVAAGAPPTPGNGLAPPPLPTAAPAPAPVATAPALPPPVAAAPPVPAAPIPVPPAPVATGPVYVMTAKAAGVTREQMHAQQWTDQLMVEHGYMVIQ